MNTKKIGLRRSLRVGLFILIGLVSIITYGWQCGSIGEKQYTFYPYEWTTGSSVNTGVISATYSETLSATINPNGVDTEVYFEWGSTYGWNVTTPRTLGNGRYDITVTETVTSLLPNTTYYYRLAVLRGNDLTYTETQSFTTFGRPSCTTEIATNISSLSATLNATVNPNGLATTIYFQWGLSSSYGNRTADQSIGSGVVGVFVASNITGLSAYTNYSYRVVAVNIEGTVYGNNRTFNSGPPQPVATTGSASSINYNSAIINGVVNPNGQDTTINFQWGPVTTYGNTTSSQIIPSGSGNVNVSASLTGLAANTTYYYRLTARNPAGESYGTQVSFTTPPPPPSAATTPVTNVNYSVATLTASVNPNGLATTVYFQWGTSIFYGNTTSIQAIGSGITDVSVTATITGLLGNTNYNYRVVATNSSGTTNGFNQIFTTLVPPPSATTIAATGIAAFTATLNASVNPNGGATTVYFEYGTTITYGSSTTPTAIGSGTGPVSIQRAITGLTSSTTYYFRIVAVNGNGTTYGNRLQFNTSAQPPTAVSLPASNVTSSSGFTFNATVNPNGSTTTVYFQYGIYSYWYNYGNTSSQPIGNGRTPITVTQGFTSSTPGVTYYFRVVAYNSFGQYSYGAQQSFTTPLAGAPSVVTNPATNITRTNAQLNGTVNSNGLGTTVYFRYRTASPQGPWNIQSPPLDNGSGTGDWLVWTGQSLEPALIPNTLYEFQVYATNASGTTYGAILSFRTLP
ncbi:MAG: hypothetical protein HZA49_05685 [Planctomycetes bacterium]|nr:hypothetical protein [Planctomycetota bacterium]